MLKDLCFEVIHTCPNNCKFCSSNSSIGATKIISLDDFKKTVNHFMKNGGIEEISISGGEPDGTVLPCPAFKEMCAETLEKYGIRLYNIYDDLENLVVIGGKRANPLCKQIYGFDYSLSSDDEER